MAISNNNVSNDTTDLNNLLSNRIKQLQDNAYSVDTTLITTAEYQLFLDEMKTQGLFLQPDHWKQTTYTPSEAALPISGVRSDDAVKFCEWITEKYGNNNFIYRLPSLEEEQKVADSITTGNLANENQTLTVSWCKEKDGKIHLGKLSSEFEKQLKAKLLTSTLVLSLELADIDLQLELTISLAYELILTRYAYRAVKRTEHIYLEGYYTYELYRDCSGYLWQVLARPISVNPAFARNLDSDFDATEVKAKALELAHLLAKFFNPEEDCHLTEGRIERARERIHYVDWLEDDAEKRERDIIVEALDIVLAKDIIEVRQTTRILLMHLFEYLWRIYDVLILTIEEGRPHIPPPKKRWIFCTEPAPEVDLMKQDIPICQQHREAMYKAYWELRVVIAREAGKLPAWEGIRLVQESAN